MKKCVTLMIIFLILAMTFGCSSSEKCKTDSDCPKENKCINEKCYPNSFTPDPQVIDPNTGCSKDDECGSCKRCDDGICRPIEGCDAGIVILDGGRDIIKTDVSDVEDAEIDVETDADIGDIVEDYEDIIDGDMVEDVEPIDTDAGVDVTDLSGCDADGTLVVTSRSPGGALPRGTEITINGQGFDGECGTLSVKFAGDNNSAKITEIKSSYIKVIVPGFAQDGDITVNSFGQTKTLAGFKIRRRLFFTDVGNAITPGNQFFVRSLPNFDPYMKEIFDTEGIFPYSILLDPFNLMVLVITKNLSEEGYIISGYDFATLALIKQVPNPALNAIVTSAVMDYEKNRIYLVSANGHIYIHEMGSLTLIDDIPVGLELYGIDIDKENNRIFLSGRYDISLPPPSPPPQDYRGAVFVRDRDTFKPLGNEVVTFGDINSLITDVKYHRASKKIFALDYFNGSLYVFKADDLSQDSAPISLGNSSGPVRMTFGKNQEKLYIVCNNSSTGPVDATASIRGFDVNLLTEIVGSPFDTKLVTSTITDNTKNLVNIYYDDFDGYLIAVSNADNRIAVVVESTFTFLTNPSSPDGTVTSSTSGLFGISVEDW